ncbi:biliverdin-producing heme oxygenase [Rhizobium sp. C4]|uniref:biliverdin-producing heme oxygenase n=1 Tax=Rhizobium sp. C4 TaxID=1349800 RepID=UPI001E4FEB0C|nr:biliverdin-producing heme oxygenase [Rhizobium sp. C4]MCD2174176.1 biliverdin-producing heme oxygenase [Rhizobium sp. C4]
MTGATLSTASSSNELLKEIRARTVDLHRALDEKVADRSVLSEEGYVRFLTMHARIIPAAETWLAGRREFLEIPDAKDRLRNGSLQSDFCALGIPMPAVENMSFLNEKTSVAGICYVLEGSRLGGAYLASLIGQGGARHPVNFLCQGRERPLWRTFLDWLSSLEQSRANIDGAADAAENMFRTYLSVLD